ncbi:hypothetical protein AB205_0059140, partial [Aquarana catesbeiana]
MTNVIKSYNITYYWNASSSVTVASNSPHVTLSSLKSGSNYTITVVTVGARGYLSTPVSGSVFTSLAHMYVFYILEPYPVNQPQAFNVTSSSVSLNWTKSNEY